MKITSCLFLLFLLGSCTNLGVNENMESRLIKIEKERDSLVDRLEDLETEYVGPFKNYESTLLQEYKMSPDSIIERYEELITNYPNSYWSHEARKRIENVDQRRIYWSNEKGWQFSDDQDSKVVVLEAISCPGC